MKAIARAVTDAAVASDADNADRVLVVYVSPGEGGLWIFRHGCGVHHVGGDDAPPSSFGASMHEAIQQLWPESSPQVRGWLRIACDFLARSPVAKLLGRAARS